MRPVADTLQAKEAVTNAAVHAQSPFEIRVRRELNALRVEVVDGRPELRAAKREPAGEGGRVLAIVDGFADAWGTESGPDYKAVWFEVPPPRWLARGGRCATNCGAQAAGPLLDLGARRTDMEESVELSVERHDHTAVVSAVGEIDLAAAQRLRGVLASLTGSNVVVDLRAVSFLDSSGIGALVWGRERALGAGFNLTLRKPQGLVRRTLEIVGLADWIED
jgi:anti-sigma B factor antagonist